MDKFTRVKDGMGISSDIENFIDTYGMVSLLDVITNIANGKADHLRENWQDEGAARDWGKVAAKIGLLSASAAVDAIDYTRVRMQASKWAYEATSNNKKG